MTTIFLSAAELLKNINLRKTQYTFDWGFSKVLSIDLPYILNKR
jgi:hypothetical protein